MALGQRTSSSGLIHHSDRGSQYASHEFQQLLKAKGIACSMSGTGNCYDNAVAESFFASLKRECLHRQCYQTRSAATADVFRYIEIFYNRQRRHSYVGHRSPEQFEIQAIKQDNTSTGNEIHKGVSKRGSRHKSESHNKGVAKISFGRHGSLPSS
jgi:transposase InsO family protein